MMDFEKRPSVETLLRCISTFLVENEDEDGGQRGVLRKIRAHRFLLAGVSPVFNRMFYGPMDSFGGCWCCRRRR